MMRIRRLSKLMVTINHDKKRKVKNSLLLTEVRIGVETYIVGYIEGYDRRMQTNIMRAH